MTERQTRTTRAVRQYMDRERLSVREMAKRLGIAPSSFHARLSGRTRWSAEDLDVLILMGVEVPDAWSLDDAYRRAVAR